MIFQRGDWCSKEVVGTYGVGVWKCIRRGWEGFARHVRYDIGDGSKLIFWHDVWCGELPLKIVFLELYNIACNKDAWMEENMEIPNGLSFIGVFCLFALCMIGDLMWSHNFLNCCIPKK